MVCNIICRKRTLLIYVICSAMDVEETIGSMGLNFAAADYGNPDHREFNIREEHNNVEIRKEYIDNINLGIIMSFVTLFSTSI